MDCCVSLPDVFCVDLYLYLFFVTVFHFDLNLVCRDREKMGKAKYLLAAKTNDGSQRPCAFFNLPQGCRRGDECPFLHSTEVIPSSNTISSKDSSLNKTKKEDPELKKANERKNASNPFLSMPTASSFPGVNNKRKRGSKEDDSSDSDSDSSSNDSSSTSSSDGSTNKNITKRKNGREVSMKSNPINTETNKSEKPEKKKLKSSTVDSSSLEVELLKKQLEQQAQTQQLLLQQLQAMQQNQNQLGKNINGSSDMQSDDTNKPNINSVNNGNNNNNNDTTLTPKLSQKQKRKLRKQKKMEQEILVEQLDQIQGQSNQQQNNQLQKQTQSQLTNTVEQKQYLNSNPFLALKNETKDRRDSSASIISGLNSTYSVDEILKNTKSTNVKAAYADKISALPSTPFMLESTQTLADIGNNKSQSLTRNTSTDEKTRRTSSSNLLANSDLPFSPVPLDVAKPTKVKPEPKLKTTNSHQMQETQVSTIDSNKNMLTSQTKGQVKVERVRLPDGASRWLPCIQKTLENPKYESRYANLNNGIVGVNGWVQAKKCGTWCKDLPHALALDCEMCSTKDPVSGNKDDKALLRISVVNGNNIEDIILDSLVMPSMPIDEYRTHIHGISPSHMENVTFTLRHAQAALRQICCDKTVLIGHAIINDLQALKFYHPLVIDTSFLYRRETESPDIWKPASLAACVASVLPKEDRLKLSHDSVTDAQMTQRIAERYLNFGPSDPIPNKEDWKAKLAESKRFLLAHRIPEEIQKEHIEGLINAQAQTNPLKVHDISFNGNAKVGRCLIEFTSEEAAENVFQALNGAMKPDKDGRKQKKIFYGATEKKSSPTNNNYIFIRLNYYEKATGTTNDDNMVVDEANETNMQSEDKINPFLVSTTMTSNNKSIITPKSVPLSLQISTSAPKENLTNMPTGDAAKRKGKTRTIVQYY